MGVICPSDDEEMPAQGADQDGELAAPQEEAADIEAAEKSSMLSDSALDAIPSDADKAERKKKVKAARLAKRKEKEDKEWMDLTEDAMLPAEHQRRKSTAPKYGGPGDKIKCQPGDHPIMYFRELWPLSVNDYLAENSNTYASGRGAGGKCYPQVVR